MQLHLDALTHQYKHLNESMAALSAATKSLTECVQQLQGASSTQPAQQGSTAAGGAGRFGRQQGGAVQWVNGSSQGKEAIVVGSAVLIGLGAVAGGMAAAAAMLLLRSRQ
jgi:hypothetical protein